MAAGDSSKVLGMLLLFSMVLLGLVAFSSAQVTDDEIVEILRAHNNIRSKVDPIATNMEELEWNDELAYSAQFWAGGCVYEINENRHSQSTTFGYVGQSLASTSTSYPVNYTILIQTWKDLGKYYNFYSGACTDADGNEDEDGEACASYIQLVSAYTYAVGCGAFKCDELEGAEDDDESALFFVCNYGPSANPGEKPYQSGSEPCSACPSNKAVCVNNLCAESGAIATVQVSVLATALMMLIAMVMW